MERRKGLLRIDPLLLLLHWKKSLGENSCSLSLSFPTLFFSLPLKFFASFPLFGTRCNLDGKRGRGSKFTGGRVRRVREREAKMLERKREEKEKGRGIDALRTLFSSLFFFWYFWYSTVVVHPRSKKEARNKRRMKEGHEKDGGGNG